MKYDGVGRVLDCFLYKLGGLDFQSNISEAFGLTFYCSRVKKTEQKKYQNISHARLDNLAQQVYYYAILECKILIFKVIFLCQKLSESF